MSSVFQLLLQPSYFARLAASHAVVIDATAFCITATSPTAELSERGGSLPYRIFVLLTHSVFPLDGADITIAFAAERAAASTRSMVSCDTLVNVCARLALA